MDRLERLVNLVAALIDAERPLTREQLRERVGGYSDDPAAFRRNFERDKELLRQMGLPLVTEALEADRAEDQLGYRIPRDRYELPDPGLSDDELAALRLASSAVGLNGSGLQGATTTALRKLGGVASEAASAVSLADLGANEKVAVVFGAVADRRQLEFSYRGRDRVVDPWHLSYRKGQWYLAGLDCGRGEERMFRLDRVDGTITAVGEPGAFARPPGGATAPPPAWRLGDGPAIDVELLVDASHAGWAQLQLGESAVVERRPDGACRLSVEVTSLDAFRSFALNFLEHAEILGPPEARAGMIEWLSAATGERCPG